MSRRTLFVVLLISATAASAATPPTLLNYQGVLRDALNHPLSGSYDMVFTFFSAAASGDEILKDSHVAAAGAAVTVTGGLFDVALGGGAILDGSGPGTYTSLADVFADYGEVWMQITVGAETLAPRVRVVSAAYALNASHLQGKDASGFLDTSAASQTKTGPLTLSSSAAYGLTASGPMGGAFLSDSDGTGVCYAASGNTGVVCRGSSMGGQFENTSTGAVAGLGVSSYGIDARATAAGGLFADSDGTGYAYVGHNNDGIYAEGSTQGGFFRDSDGLGTARAGYGTRGIEAYGTGAGGYFWDTDGSGWAYVGYDIYGVYAEGGSTGGYFRSSAAPAEARTTVATIDYGIKAEANAVGGYFADVNQSGEAWVGYGDLGIYSRGNEAGGRFRDWDASGEAYVGYGNLGVDASGTEAGADFQDSDGTGYATLARGNGGIYAEGDTLGGHFEDLTSTTYAYVGYGSYTVYGNGTKSFVQNHPRDPSKVLAYAALEGDEAGTYTRGTGRLVNGEARIALGETFRWVTNPDVGLTVQLTPRSAGASLYAASLTTEELVVRAQEGSDPEARFDFLVLGLRLGFEDLLIERDRVAPAPLPSRDEERAELERDPARADGTPLARFARMREQAGESGALDLSRSRELAAAIGRGTPKASAGEPPAEPAAPPAAGDGVFHDDQETISGRSFRSAHPGMASLLPVSEPVQPGDVLAIDPDRPGTMRPARTASDPGVVGVVAAQAGLVLGGGEDADQGLAPTVTAGVVLCRVDADYGAIRPGTLLTTSPTPGHAMRADDPAPGTVLGKALESLEQGAGLVRVLVMMR